MRRKYELPLDDQLWLKLKELETRRAGLAGYDVETWDASRFLKIIRSLRKVAGLP